MKKILIITPTPTHPVNAGNRAAIVVLATQLMDAGFEVHCLYFPAEDYDIHEMSKFFNGHFYTTDRLNLNYKIPSARYYIKRIFQKLSNVKLYFLETLLGAKAEPYKFNKKIDETLNASMREITRGIANKHHFDIVISEYVWMSGLLKYFPKTTFKIIDTHDRFSNRYLVYKRLNRIPEWNSLFPSEEAKGLKRADLLLALSNDEREYFHKISGVKTILRLPAILNKPLKKKTFENRLLYFASDNSINVTSIQMFLHEVFPAVQKEIPAIKLYIGGNICNKLVDIPENVQLHGVFDDPADFYHLGDIIINPEIDGTGFKIKTFEGLSYGIPVVTTKAGAEGVLDKQNNHLILVNDAKEFSEAVILLSRNENLRNEISVNAYRWAKHATENNNKEFIQLIKNNLS